MINARTKPDPDAATSRPSLSTDRFGVLGTPLAVTNYEELTRLCQEWARQPGCTTLEFANTHIVTMRRRDAAFRDLTREFDYFIPDATPLIWCLNWQGAGLKDRVYGPAFMRHCLVNTSSSFTHYLLGGTEECGRRLREVFQQLNPGIRFVGSYHGTCSPDGRLEEGADEPLISELNRLSPDFIWVAFSDAKPAAWLRRHKARLKRGVILTVGFAFDANAGLKPDAPMWLQRLGLTWLFRLVTEPRRLAGRYLKYNTLFLFYLLWDGLRGRALGPGEAFNRPSSR